MRERRALAARDLSMLFSERTHAQVDCAICSISHLILIFFQFISYLPFIYLYFYPV